MNRVVEQLVEEGPQVIQNYLRSLYWLWMAADPRKGKEIDGPSNRHEQPGSRIPSRPVAGGRFDRELSWLVRQTKHIEEYLDAPDYMPATHTARRRCPNCKKGLARGWVYCPMCGVWTERAKAS